MLKTLKIKIRDNSGDGKDVKVTIPLKALEIIQKLMPRRIKDELADEGIDLAEITEAAKTIDEAGTLVEVEAEDKEIKITLE